MNRPRDFWLGLPLPPAPPGWPWAPLWISPARAPTGRPRVSFLPASDVAESSSFQGNEAPIDRLRVQESLTVCVLICGPAPGCPGQKGFHQILGQPSSGAGPNTISVLNAIFRKWQLASKARGENEQLIKRVTPGRPAPVWSPSHLRPREAAAGPFTDGGSVGQAG